MATYTTNYNLEKPEASDEFGDFRTSYNSNMDIIDQNLGGGGGSSTLAGLSDVSLTTPVTGDALIYDGAEWANTPLADVATSGDYSDLLNTPSLATVATSGSYTDLSNTPTIPTALSDLTDDTTHRVVTDTQISTWNGKSDFSGSYNDLTDKPTIPTVNDGTLTIQQNGTTVGTFTANQSGNTTVNLTSGGGSAHTIVNESGTALADEPNLQFTDGLKATDDSINSKTVVGVNTTFTEASTRTNIASGDTFATILGKIKKWFSDLPSMFVPLITNGGLGIVSASGTDSYAFIAEIDTNNTYINVPLYLEISGRDAEFTTVQIIYVNSGSVDPNLESFTIDEPYFKNYIKIFKVSAGKWQLYADISTWDNVALHRVSGGLSARCDVKMTKVPKASFTLTWADGTAPTYGGYVAHADTADSATDNTKVAKAGDTMTGKLILSTAGLEYPNIHGYSADQYGDLWHKQSNANDYLGFKSYDESKILKYYWETGKLAVSGDVSATGTVILGAENDVCLNLRPSNNNWADTVSTQTGGDEAVVFASKNSATSWLFVSGEDSVTNHATNRWQSLTPGLQIKNNCVSIGKLIASGTSPSHELDVRGRARFDFGGSGFVTTVQIGSSNSGGQLLLYNSKEGALWANTLSADRSWRLPDKNGTIAMTSDISSRRFKENILPMTDDECKKILDVDVVTFDYKEDANVVGEKERVGNRGVIAEDVAELIPTAVEYEETDGEQIPYGVNYTKFIPYLIKMVQIQQREIEELKSMLADKEN